MKERRETRRENHGKERKRERKKNETAGRGTEKKHDAQPEN